jgi:hypothetical protein
MRDDNRAVSTVIGVVILFGFLILALSLYQVEVVPQQNAETEFQHSGEVRNDLVELRAGILQAGSIDQPQYQTVQLGTTYSTRVFTINPPAPSGTIRTSESYPITIAYESNDTVIETIPTRFIEYQPGYNELDRSPTWYDASVLYLDARDEGGGIAVIEDQALVDNGEVQITALQNEFRRSGTGQVTLELRPAESVTSDIPEGDLTVTIPTRLSEDDWETKTNLPTDSDVYDGVTDTGADIGNMNIYKLTLDTTANDLTVDTVGVQETPEAPTQNDAARVGSEPIETTGSFSGTVVDEGGEPVTEEVAFEGGDENVLGTATPDAEDGSYTVEGIEEGTNDITASAGGFQDSDPVEVEITTGVVTTGVDFTLVEDDENELPEDAVAFFDENGNGEFDDGEETYTVAELEERSVDGTLIVSRDVIMDDGPLGGIEIDAERIVVEDGIEMRTTGGGQSIDLTSEGELLFTDAEIRTGGPDIDLQAGGGGQLTADGATIAVDGSGSIDLTSTGVININSAAIQSDGPITIDAGGQLNAESVNIETMGGGSNLELTSGEAMNINSAEIQSIASTTINAGGQLNAQNASIVATGGGSDVNINSDGDIIMPDANVEGVNINLDSDGFINLDRTNLAAASYGELDADLTGNADLFVDDAEFTSGGDPTDLSYGPGRSVNVIGNPAIGGTSN